MLRRIEAVPLHSILLPKGPKNSNLFAINDEGFAILLLIPQVGNAFDCFFKLWSICFQRSSQDCEHVTWLQCGRLNYGHTRCTLVMINPTCVYSTEHPMHSFNLHAPNCFVMLFHLLGWTATKLAKACGHQSLADLLSIIEKRRTFVMERKVSSPHPHSSRIHSPFFLRFLYSFTAWFP